MVRPVGKGSDINPVYLVSYSPYPQGGQVTLTALHSLGFHLLSSRPQGQTEEEGRDERERDEEQRREEDKPNLCDG